MSIEISPQELGEDWESKQKVKESQHQELEDAIQRFLNKGRSIKVLPPQEVRNRSVVGGDRWEMNELLSELNQRSNQQS
ncbi:MAG: hypothetical protein ACO4AU_10890 [bacterium]|jgi:phage/plasmid primase-like uncharacterized protein